MIPRFAVIGNPISHSLSPRIHALFAKQVGCDLTYETICTQPEMFANTVSDFFLQGGSGLNVTLPFKEDAFRLAEVRTPRCEQAKAANTLWMHEGCLHADTTDGAGCLADLSRYVSLEHKKVLLWGAGGAARSILGPLLALPIAQITVVNRNVSRAKALQVDFPKIQIAALSELHQSFDVMINATSLGLSHEPFSLPPSLVTPSTYCYDLMYDVLQATPFVAMARQHGCVAHDGLGMLVEQAALAFFIWHGIMPDPGPVLVELRNT